LTGYRHGKAAYIAAEIQAFQLREALAVVGDISGWSKRAVTRRADGGLLNAPSGGSALWQVDAAERPA
jgi:hypothetical protein